MRLIRQTGDLLDIYKNGDLDAIAHCCNCQGVMGSGIALSIKTDFPDAYSAYKLWEEMYGLELGTYSVSSTASIYNLHAQHLYGKAGDTTRFVDYEAIASSLEGVKRDMIEYGNRSIGFPYKMGADRAGGDWDVIEAIIKSVFKDTDIDVYIIEYDGTRNK